MTDQPNGPTEPTPDPSAPGSEPSGAAQPGPGTAPPPSGPYAGPPQGGEYPPPQQGNPYAPQPQGGQYAPQPQGGQYAPQPQGGQYGPPQGGQYGAPGYPAPAANPYGGYAQAPAYAGGGPAAPGSIGYVEQNFGKVADFGQRALAYLIDLALTLIGLVPMVIGIIMLVAAAPSVYVDEFGNTVSGGDSDPGLALVGGLLVALGVLLSLGITIWNRIFKMGRTGQSVGKKVIGLYLLDDKTGRPIGAGMSFLRELVQGLVNQIFYLGWLWMLWDTDKQTLGDKTVHSTVVVLPKG